MNYYNPYFSTVPYNYTPTLSTSRNLLNSLFGGGKLSTIINGTQKTLGIINQAIPIVKQMSPVMKNAKTMFKVMNEFKKVEKPLSTNNDQTTTNTIQFKNKEEQVIQREKNNVGPTFFL